MLDQQVQSRILASLNHEEGDRVPIWDYIDNRAIVDYVCPGWSDYHDAMVKVYHTLGIDLCRGYGASYSEQDDGTEHVSENGTVQRKILGQTNWLVDYPIKTLEDLKTFQREPISEEWANSEWINHLKAQITRFEPYTMYVPGGGCGFHATYGLMGQELFSYAIYDDPVNVERLLEIETESAYRLAKAAARAKLCPIYFIGDDIACKGKLLFSPEFLRRTFVRSLKKCIEPLKAAGIKVIFHSDGYVMEILDDMIEAGIDGLNPIEPLAGMDIAFLKKEYGRHLVLVGGVDCSQLLPRGTVDEVVRATREIIRIAAPGGGFFVGSSSEIVPTTPVENILAFYETCREAGKYPIAI
ncbi:MAG: uroporphyrinogen decarboxylase family protein [Armatimonadota bacterium]|nr:uroporphyrinogen decarboxylase family protein [Armatimonadota bacterium]